MIVSQRMDLVPANTETVRAAIDDRDRLGRLLQAEVPPSWPPELLDEDALRWTLDWLSDVKNDPTFGFYWLLLRPPSAPARTRPVLVGVAGFKGIPKDGMVEIGYGVVADYQRRGFASEAVRALVSHAFDIHDVTRVIAETLPEHVASIGVLEKCGFRFIGDGSEPGVIRYELNAENQDARKH